MGKKCPKHNEDLVKWFSGTGGQHFLGCPNITCNYKEEIE